MQFQVKGRNLEVSDSIRSYAEEKLGKLERQLTDPRVELELMLEKNPSIADNQVAEATIWTTRPGAAGARGVVGHARVDRPARREARAAGDALPHTRRATAGAAPPGRPRPPSRIPVDRRTSSSSRSSRPSSSRSTPMTPEEAVLQLELVGHDFFVFRSGDSDAVNIVYRRRDGDYGLIEPQ